MSKKATLLFVDDEERIVNLLRLMFRTSHEVLTATSGAEALEIIRSRKVHVLVSDQRMPGMTGVELLAAVAKESPQTVRLLLTGYSDLAAIVGSVNEGEVFRFLNKPWDQEAMRQTLAEATQIALLGDGEGSPRTVAPEASTARANAGVLVLDDSDEDREEIAAHLGRDHVVHQASTIADAVRQLNTHDIGVMVCESQIGGQDTGELLHLLKNNFPAIMTVMLTQAADSDDVIRLINQARIYRFATKPIRPAVLQLSVSAAMKEHSRCLSDTRHAARQRTVARPEGEASPAVKGILQGLKSLAARWKLFAA